MNNLVVYDAKCNNCQWHMVLMSKDVIEYQSESHMMETGHTVEITGV